MSSSFQQDGSANTISLIKTKIDNESWIIRQAAKKKKRKIVAIYNIIELITIDGINEWKTVSYWYQVKKKKRWKKTEHFIPNWGSEEKAIDSRNTYYLSLSVCKIWNNLSNFLYTFLFCGYTLSTTNIFVHTVSLITCATGDHRLVDKW